MQLNSCPRGAAREGSERRRRFGAAVAAVTVAVFVLGLIPWATAALFHGGVHSNSDTSVIPAPVPCATGGSPMDSGYDPLNHFLYVPNFATANITVLKGTCTLEGTISLPTNSTPVAMAFDPQNNEMYVTDSTHNVVYGILGLGVAATLASSYFSTPSALMWDPEDSLMLVTNVGSNTMNGFYENTNGTGTVVLKDRATGVDPVGICYDPILETHSTIGSGSILVVNAASHNVSIFSALDPFVNLGVYSGATGSDPRACAFDQANSNVYVVNYQSGNVTVMNGSGGYVASVSVGPEPTGVGWDQATLEMFVSSHLKGSVSVISNYTVVRTLKNVAANAEGVTFDSQNNLVYVSSASGDDVGVVS